MSTGWIKLHRQLLDWEWYDDNNTKCLFLHCLLRANHADTEWRGHKLKRGQFLTSVETLTRETGLTTSQIRTSLKKLLSTSEIASKSQARSTVITVLGYDSHQDSDKVNSKVIAIKSQDDDKLIATDKNLITKECKNKDLYQQIVDAWNEKFSGELSAVSKLTQKRKSAINGCIKEMASTEHDFSLLETWVRFFDFASGSSFLMGENKEGWTMSFDFITTKSKLIKIIEGDYANK